MPLWWELSSLVTIMLLGHWMEMRSISQAQGALKELAKLLPNTATRIVDRGTEDVPVGELRDGRHRSWFDLAPPSPLTERSAKDAAR